MVSYPTSLDAFSNPTAGDATNNVTTPHATQHSNANDAIEALEAKLGTGASTATANTVLRGTGAGASAFGQVQEADLAFSVATQAEIDAHAADTTTHGTTGDVVGTSDSQTLTNKTITQPNLTLKQGANPTPTAEGDAQWDTDDNTIKVGDGAATKEFGYLGSTTPSTVTSGGAASVGTSKETSRADHAHAMADMATQAELDSHKSSSDHDGRYFTEAESDARFAPIAKGVTNGDSHDHSGGDGAQIDHGGLAGLGDDDHTQYALVAGTETITSAWTFNEAPVLGQAAPATPTANKLYKDAMVKGWASCTTSGGTPSLNDDFNVSSITDNGVGDFTVTWATAFASANYAYTFHGAAYMAATQAPPTTTTARVSFLSSAGAALDPAQWFCIACGDQ